MPNHESLAIARDDAEFVDHVVKAVHNDHLDLDDSGCIGFSNVLGADVLPKAGDTVRLFGRGFGYTVRGIGLVENDLVTQLYRYRTEAQAAADHEAWVADEKAKKVAAWAANTETNLAKLKAMPAPFRERIERFMARPEWGPEFGPYELFVCGEAVKIAEALKTRAAIEAYRKLPYGEQAAALPLDEGHSGNTFGSACLLAAVYLEQPELVARVHGALCPLVGCKEYGCWAAHEGKAP